VRRGPRASPVRVHPLVDADVAALSQRLRQTR
jgi:hypothetical protein